ncbi:hypothetical protein SJAG_00612 [Schizosaccharomyces japonicus yFS275]|uniref:Carrier protein n=1 Tax=Schizosaccharomyces japonicus (strain yFS275 / FY16936) TaxID=402676 RepID=B6JW43_SCHJY|nr:hypothetical protein SJAG_00612 [Schizosaccharomyces japonicus yFS275]EEB05594.1 hypothetical protein SJAG_00612 [Schizosaccharomyces japonicus yFS275]
MHEKTQTDASFEGLLEDFQTLKGAATLQNDEQYQKFDLWDKVPELSSAKKNIVSTRSFGHATNWNSPKNIISNHYLLTNSPDTNVLHDWFKNSPHSRVFLKLLQNSSEGDVVVTQSILGGYGYFACGGLSGIVSRTLTAPLDRLKVLLISNTQRQPLFSLHHSALLEASKTVWRKNGIRGFYVGNGLNILKVIPESSIRFGTYEAAKRFLNRNNKTQPISPGNAFLAGGIAGSVAQVCMYPLDTIKFRMQCVSFGLQNKRRLMMSVVKDLYKVGGLRAFYRGVLIGVLGIFPYSAADLGTFEGMKQMWIRISARRQHVDASDVELPSASVLCFGALSGSFGAILVFPLNVLRTRLQTQGTAGHRSTYKGFWDVAHKTIRNEGWSALYKGLFPNLLKVAPSVAISYLVYESSKSWLGLT